MLCFYSKESYRNEILSVIKTECAWVVHKEVNETIDDVVVQTCGRVQIALHDNVFMSLNFSITAQVVGGEMRKKSLSVFFDRGMAGGHVREASTQ